MVSLSSRIDVSAPAVYYDDRFKMMIEQHLTALIAHKGNTYLKVTPLDMEVWQGNLYGYLYSEQVPVFQHWLIMRMNGMDSTLDFDGDFTNLILPDIEQINRLRDLFNTVHRIV